MCFPDWSSTNLPVIPYILLSQFLAFPFHRSELWLVWQGKLPNDKKANLTSASRAEYQWDLPGWDADLKSGNEQVSCIHFLGVIFLSPLLLVWRGRTCSITDRFGVPLGRNLQWLLVALKLARWIFFVRTCAILKGFTQNINFLILTISISNTKKVSIKIW